MKHALSGESGGIPILEVVLLAVVVSLAALAYYQYNTHKTDVGAAVSPKPHVADTTSPTKMPAPPVGFKNGLLEGQKVAFTYPSNWKIATESQTDDKGITHDRDTVTSPNALSVQLDSGLSGIGGGCNCTVVDTEPIMAFGQAMHLNYDSSDGNKTVGLSLSTTATCAYICLIKPTNGINGADMMFTAFYTAKDGSTYGKPLNIVKNDPDVAAAKAIFSSLHYIQ
jgi:hypothetical protein